MTSSKQELREKLKQIYLTSEWVELGTGEENTGELCWNGEYPMEEFLDITTPLIQQLISDTVNKELTKALDWGRGKTIVDTPDGWSDFVSKWAKAIEKIRSNWE